MSALTVRVEGGLLSPDFLERIAEAAGQKPADFGLPPRYALVDEVAKVWGDVRSYWLAFQTRLARGGESTTTITRDMWVLPLLETLGYRLVYRRRAAQAGGRSYALSHRAGENDDAPPVHIVGCDQELGNRPPGGGQLSPHALVQDYLNRADHLWGIVTNGYILRLLRDSSYFTRPTYVEFDLQEMLAGERLDEFLLFYRLVHRTRLPQGTDDAPQCLLERYHQEALEQGGRIREGLRAAVEQALLTLGNGFLQHPRNEALREQLRRGDLSARGLYQQLLYLVYRFLFLMVAEERHLLLDDAGGSPLYQDHFSLSRLRALAQEPLNAPERFDDLYLGLQVLFAALGDERAAAHLGLPVLNGELFFRRDLDGGHLNNRDLLAAVRGLSTFVPAAERVPRRVNYAALDVEELGSVYESLLDYQPMVQEAAGGGLEFTFVAGTERKTTGSYYTRPELVQELIKSALEPVLAERLQAAGADPEKRLQALLALRACDPACGSGHFLLAAARRIGREVARVRTGEDEPAPEIVRAGVREAITHCIYGVDKNPLAVDLCKVALWIEGHSAGKPLTFLDHRIRCGDSLVGVLDLEVLVQGIPDEAYQPVSGDDKKVARDLRDRNRQERAGQLELFAEQVPKPDLGRLAELWRDLGVEADPDVAAVRRKEEAYHQARASRAWETLCTAANLWTAAFFAALDQQEGRHVPTTAAVKRALANPRTVGGQVVALAAKLAQAQPFFHWPLEFPDVFAAGGFDVVLSNPPWDLRQAEEEPFFASRSPEIAQLPGSRRKKAIGELPKKNPTLHIAWVHYRHGLEAEVKFVRTAGRFSHLSGKVNLYSVFAHLASQLLNRGGRAGVIVPTGIATDDSNKRFFAEQVDSQRLLRLVGFENEAFIFPAVHHSFKFCALTLGGESVTCGNPDYVFFCRYFQQVQDTERRFTLTREDIARINPNTRTCPIFRTRRDADLTRRIYQHVPVFVNEAAGENPWSIGFRQGLFNMTSDSRLFREREQLQAQGLTLKGYRFVGGREVYLPLYEAKMIWHFDHRFATYEGASQENLNAGILPQTSEEQKQSPSFAVLPRYWVAQPEVESALDWRYRWLLGFRDVTSAVVQRTAIFSLLPRVAVGHKIPLVMPGEVVPAILVPCLLSNFNSLVVDFTLRQKIGGTSLSYFILKQLPILPPSAYTPDQVYLITPRVLELVYTAWDLTPFADDLWQGADTPLRAALETQWQANAAATGGGHAGAQPPAWVERAPDGFPHPPFKWDEARRAVLRAELDALYARLYGLTEEELRYILDPADVYGPDFPGETFRVLKEKEIKQYGEYRTKRLVLEAWGRLDLKVQP